MSEAIKKIGEWLSEQPLVAFAIGAGTAVVTVSLCWAVVKILQMLFA